MYIFMQMTSVVFFSQQIHCFKSMLSVCGSVFAGLYAVSLEWFCLALQQLCFSDTVQCSVQACLHRISSVQRFCLRDFSKMLNTVMCLWLRQSLHRSQHASTCGTSVVHNTHLHVILALFTACVIKWNFHCPWLCSACLQ